jgi:uncharacterized protein (TIGR02594 family)
MADPIWLSVARAFVGLTEHVGPGSNPVIMQWARDIGAPGWYDDDDKPWCAVALNRWLLASQLPLSGSGYELLRAASFRDYGQEMALGPALGSILVFSREGGGHVGLYTGESANHVRVLGGNQGNQVSETWIGKARLVATRWPPGVPVPFVQRVMAERGALSSGEA